MDPRRFVAPEGSFSYKSLPGFPGHQTLRKKKSKQLFMKADVLSQAKGSAYIEHGSAKVICAVYGPREIHRRSDFSVSGLLTCNVQWAPYSGQAHRSYTSRFERQAQNRPTAQEREASMIIQEALKSAVCLHLYPKSQIEVYLTILENDIGVIADAITCAGLALASASISMYDLILGVSTKSSEKDETQTFTIGYLPNLEQIAATTFEGSLEPDELIKLIEKLSLQAKELVPTIQQVLKESMLEDS